MKTREEIRAFFASQPACLRAQKARGEGRGANPDLPQTQGPQNPPRFATVSGVVSTSADMIKYVHDHLDPIALITTKSIQIEPNPGNREPIIVEDGVGSYGNSVGLRNKGMEATYKELEALLQAEPFNKILNISLSGSSPEEFITLIKRFEPLGDMFELNFSCPHAAAGYGSSIGASAETVATYIQAIRAATDAPIFPKLTPNVENLGAIAQAAVEAGADGIVAINTVGPVEHRDPGSGYLVLNNSLGGKGGKSGRSIFRQATHAIREIREAIGPDVPIIGMGGVISSKEAASLISAGANLVGIGSGFGMVRQEHWSEWLHAIQEGTCKLLRGEPTIKGVRKYLELKPQMEYQPVRIAKKERYQSDVTIFTMDRDKRCKPGEFYFVWIPGVGEKPFSAAGTQPLTFLVKERGPFTKAFSEQQKGATLYVRGPYGRDAEFTTPDQAILVGGGTGVAVLPLIAHDLYEKGCDHIESFCGVTKGRKPLLQDKLQPYGTYHLISDNGKVGRVIDEATYAIRNPHRTKLYVVGPEPFMERMAEQALRRGVASKDIHISLEQTTRCGIGICGECSCHGKLTCQCGTFVTYQEYKGV